MDDVINVSGKPVPADEMTLLGAITELIDVSWKIKGLVYGQTEQKEPQADEPMPADKITFARNEVMGATQRLREVALRLETLGK